MRANGVRHVGRWCLFITAPPRDGKLRFGIVTSRRYSKRAVDRNRARRLLREAFRQELSGYGSVWLLLIPRHRMKDAKLADVLNDFRNLSARAGIRNNGPAPQTESTS